MQSHNSTQSPALRPSAAHGASASSSLATAASPSTLAAGFPLSATHGVDGLPLLPSHAQSCEVDPPRALLPLDYGHEAFSGGRGVCDHAAVVDVFGDVSSRDAIREKLLRFYQDTKQVVAGVVNAQVDNGEKKSASVEIVGDGISEMTLRIDTELELLRQQCFAERNAQWDYHTPDMFSYEPVREPMWNPLLAGNANIALRRLKYDAALDRDEKEGTANAIAASGGGGNGNSGGASGKKDGKGFPLGEFSRERPWPPREFMQKATTRPSRARGGKRKAPAPIVEQRSVFSKVCAECHTQSTPLWRKIARESTKVKNEEAVNGVDHVKSEAGDTKPPIAPVITNGALATAATPSTTAEPNVTTATTLPVDQAQLLQTVGQQAEVDVCLECYLKLQRSDIFARKQLERAQKELEKRERIAAEAALEKKRLKQQLQMLKKQTQAKSKKRKPAPQELVVAPETAQQESVSEVATTPTTAIKIVIKTDVVRDDHHVAVFEAQQEELREQKEERDHSKSAKRDKKKSKKDKKKKKKKKRRDDSGDDESDSGTPMPSPPQMVGQYEYADLASGGLRTSRSASSVTSFDAVVESHNVEYEDGPVQQQATATTSAVAEKQEHVIEERHHEEEQAVAVEESVTTSKRTRKSANRRDSVTTISTSTAPTTTAATAAASSSKSRKRKNSVVAVPVVAPEPVVEAQATTSSRSSRSRASSLSSSSAASVVVPAVAPVPVAAAAVTTPARKRARTKKESARERELRALGQYCPVCNFVYEEDDESSFVCCDSCEMWVHAACDTTLTPALLAALADTAEKYICPLCAGR